MNILLVDDERLIVDGIGLLLMKYSSDVVITKSHSGQHALGILDKRQKENEQPYSLIFVDLYMKGLDGFDFLKATNSRKISSPVIILTVETHPDSMRKAIKLGALGFMPKSISKESLFQGISSVLKGDLYVPDEYADGALYSNHRPKITGKMNIIEEITPRLMEVLELLQKGHSNKEIATIMGITEATVKSHLQKLYSIFDVRNRTACVREAIKNGILPNENY